MITELQVTASVPAMPITPVPYHLVIRSLISGSDSFEWREYNGLPMDYPTARYMLLGMEQRLPSLHKPGSRFYLLAEPIRVGA